MKNILIMVFSVMVGASLGGWAQTSSRKNEKSSTTTSAKAMSMTGTVSSDGKMFIDFGSFDQTAYKVLLQPDGKIVTVGYPNTESSDSDFLLARLKRNGSLDRTFGIGGKVRTSFGDLNGGAYGAVLQPDGKIVAVGFQATFTNRFAEFALARYLGN